MSENGTGTILWIPRQTVTLVEGSDNYARYVDRDNVLDVGNARTIEVTICVWGIVDLQSGTNLVVHCAPENSDSLFIDDSHETEISGGVDYPMISNLGIESGGVSGGQGGRFLRHELKVANPTADSTVSYEVWVRLCE